ncbi:MAG: ATP-binding cassette domain-containing protein [Gammaproteobacteria bacterium]|nr:ATP-binding cassette domain-containing protein [Gammaproteobacteria bacterium]
MTVELGHPVVFWVRIKSADGALHRVAVNDDAQRRVSAARVGIFCVLDASPPIQAPAVPRAVAGDLSPCVHFDDIVFSYPGSGRSIHQHLSLALAPGERVGVVGPSGCGKSSLVKLLLRFHALDSGQVKLGGVNIRELTSDDLYRHLAVVSQGHLLKIVIFS